MRPSPELTAATMIRPFTALLVAVAAAPLAACGGGSDTTAKSSPSATATTTATATGTATAAPTPQGGIDTMPDASTRPVNVPATDKRAALLTAVRAGRHEGFDRVVFQFLLRAARL